MHRKKLPCVEKIKGGKGMKKLISWKTFKEHCFYLILLGNWCKKMNKECSSKNCPIWKRLEEPYTPVPFYYEIRNKTLKIENKKKKRIKNGKIGGER